MNGHLMVSKRSRVTLRTGVKPSPPVRGTHQLQTPYVRMGLVPNSLELFQVRWACTEARLAVLIRRVRIPLAMRACLKEVQGRPAGNPTRYSNGFRDFQSKSEWLFARRILVFERDRIRNYSFESGNNGQGRHNRFWCIIIECLWRNTKFSLRIKNYPRGQLQKNCPPSRVDIIIQHSLMARRCLETILIEKIFVDDAVITIKADFQSPSLSLSRFSLNYYRILKSFPLWKDFGKLGVFPRRAIILLSPRAK